MSSRSFRLAFTLIVLHFSSTALAQTDSIAKRIESAESAYSEAMTKYEEDLVAWFATEEEDARKAGKTDIVDVLAEALSEFRDSGRLPAIAPVKLNQKAWTAQQKFETALVKAASDYTKKGLDSEAEGVNEKLKAFRRKTDRLPKGCEWKGVMTGVDRVANAKPFQDQAEVTVVARTFDTVTLRAALKEQRQWEYEFEATGRSYSLIRAELVVVQNNFGEPRGKYPAEGTLVFQGQHLVLKVSRKLGKTVRDVQYELAPAE